MRNPKRDTPYFKAGLTLFLSLTAVILVYVLLTHLVGIGSYLKVLARSLRPVGYGLAIAYLLCFPMNFFERHLQKALHARPYDPLNLGDKQTQRKQKLCRTLAILITMLLLALIVWALVAMLLPRLAESVTVLISNLDDYYATVESWVLNLVDYHPELVEYTSTILVRFEGYLTDYLTNTIVPYLQALVASLTSSVIGMVVGALNVLVGLIIAIYVLYSKDNFLRQGKKILRSTVRDTWAYWILDVARHAHMYFGKFLTGKIIDSAVIGVLCFIGASILGLPYSLLISVFVGATNIIPIFGPFLGAIPSAFLILMVSPAKCLYFILFILALQQLDGHIIGPAILGDRVNVSAFWIVVSILFFGKLWGVAGMIVGVPCFAVINYIITTLVNRRLTRRGLSDRQVLEEDYPDMPEGYSKSTKNRVGEDPSPPEGAQTVQSDAEGSKVPEDAIPDPDGAEEPPQAEEDPEAPLASDPAVFQENASPDKEDEPGKA